MNHSGFRMRQNGFGLIEALIAVLVLSIGLLGLATLQAQGLRNNNSAYFRTQASIYISSMLDTMRVDLEAARNGDYDITMRSLDGDQCDTEEQITLDGSSSVADQRLHAWKASLARALPYGDGAVMCSADSCAVAVRWDAQLADGSMIQSEKYFSADTAENDQLNSCDGSTIDRRVLIVETRL